MGLYQGKTNTRRRSRLQWVFNFLYLINILVFKNFFPFLKKHESIKFKSEWEHLLPWVSFGAFSTCAAEASTFSRRTHAISSWVDFFFKSQAKNMNNSNWTSGRQSSVNWEKAKQCPVFNILPYFRKAILNSNPSQFFITQKTHFCFISQAVLPVLLCHRLLIPLEMISSLSWKV